MGRSLVLAVDASPTAQAAALWAINNVARSGDTVYLCAISPPPSYAMTPAAPIASAGAYVQVAALSVNWEQQRKAEEEMCRHLLHTLAAKLPEGKRDSLDLHKHVLPAAGGASGVAESVVAFSKEHPPDLVVVGSRGMGAVKSTLMSLVGLGSVSGYLVHNMHCPVAICRGRDVDVTPKEKRKVMVSLDDSETSKKALECAVSNVLGPEDELHLVCVALPIPYPVSLDEEATAPPVPLDEWNATYRGSMQHTEQTVGAAVEHAVGPLQVDKKRIFYKALAPEGGASDVGQSIVHYAKEKGMDVVVLGARGMGSWKRAMLSFVGLGSVSDYVCAQVECPVIVVKQ